MSPVVLSFAGFATPCQLLRLLQSAFINMHTRQFVSMPFVGYAITLAFVGSAICWVCHHPGSAITLAFVGYAITLGLPLPWHLLGMPSPWHLWVCHHPAGTWHLLGLPSPCHLLCLPYLVELAAVRGAT